MSTSPADFNAQVIEESHATDGKPGRSYTKTGRQIPVIVLTPAG